MSTYKEVTTIKKDGKNAKVEVLSGWDPVLKRFFLVITDDDLDDYVYTNLNDPQLKNDSAEYSCITYFETKAKSFGITLSPDIVKKMQADQKLDRTINPKREKRGL